jgi:hypothetical protein
MKKAMTAAVALGALMLVGCGGRPLAPGKEAAAGALFQSSRGAMGAPGALALLSTSAAGLIELKVSCPHGGQVAIRFTEDTTGGTGLSYALAYDGCNYDGHTSLRGTLTMSFEVVSTSTSVALALHLKGRVDFSGEISDFIDVDVTETVTETDLTAPAASVSLVLSGSIGDSSGTYAFTDETITIDGSGFTPAPEQG